MEFSATHKITLWRDSEVERTWDVMCVHNPDAEGEVYECYTKDEWDAYSAASFELIDWAWYFRGKAASLAFGTKAEITIEEVSGK